MRVRGAARRDSCCGVTCLVTMTAAAKILADSHENAKSHENEINTVAARRPQLRSRAGVASLVVSVYPRLSLRQLGSAAGASRHGTRHSCQLSCVH